LLGNFWGLYGCSKVQIACQNLLLPKNKVGEDMLIILENGTEEERKMGLYDLKPDPRFRAGGKIGGRMAMVIIQ
jgi:hypothetical protein